MYKCYKIKSDKWKLSLFFKTLIYNFKNTDYIQIRDFEVKNLSNELYAYISLDKSKTLWKLVPWRIVVSPTLFYKDEYKIIDKDSEAGFILWIRELADIKIKELSKIADDKEKTYNYEIQMRRKYIKEMKNFFEIQK